MAGDSDSGASIPAAASAEVILEGCLLKQGIRGARQWNDRYFVFTSNNTLAYYSQTNDDKPKFVYPISKEAGCELSSIYEEHRSIKSAQGSARETIYCIKLTWTMPVRRITDEQWEDTSLTGAGPESFQNHHRRASSPPTIPSSQSTQSLHARHLSYSPAPPRSGTSSQPAWHSERRLAVSEPHDFMSGPPSPRQRQRPGADHDVTPQPGRTHELSRSRGASYRFRSIKPTMSEDDNYSLDLPHISSQDDRMTSVSRKHDEDYEDDAPTSGRSHVDEQKQLHTIYLQKKKQSKKKTKKKLTDGAKLALAAGAFVGLGVLTAGASLAGLAILGAAAAAGGTGAAGAAANSTWRRGKKRETELIIASANYEEAKRWHAILNACLQSESARESTWGQLFFQEGRSAARTMLPVDASGILTVRSRDGPNTPRRGGGSEGSDGKEQDPRDRFALRDRAQPHTFVVPGTRWKPMEGGWLSFFGTGAQGLRIFKDDAETKLSDRGIFRRMLGGAFPESRPCPPLKAHILLNASPLNAFMCLMSYARMPDNQANHFAPNSGQRVSFRVLETIDDHMDVIHVISRPLYLFPSYTSPRDFVVFRYWRFESDGSCVVCVESIEHPNCPPHPDFVRGEMHAAYTISPKKQKSGNRFVGATSEEECLLTAVVQVDPKGWVPLRPIPFLADQGYGEAFGISALLQLLDIRDAIDLDRFLPVGFESSNPSHQKLLKKSMLNGFAAVPAHGMGINSTNSVDFEEDGNDDNCNYDFAFAGRESSVDDISMRFASHPTPYPVECWAEPDPNSFRVRGKTYKQDREKVNAGPSIGRLVAVDILLAEEAVYSGVSTHPNERIQLGLQREKALKEKGLPSDMPPFVFVVNIVLPGPPVYHGVFYYAVDDRSTIDGTDGTPSSKLCSQFLFGDDDKFRDKTFKLIPQIVEGNFLVRKAVGSTPAIMGTKLKQYYVRSDRYFEVVLDCGSSSVASGVIRVVLPYSVHLTVDMGFLLEGNDESTLPERIFGCVRMKSVGFGPHLRRISRPT